MLYLQKGRRKMKIAPAVLILMISSAETLAIANTESGMPINLETPWPELERRLRMPMALNRGGRTRYYQYPPKDDWLKDHQGPSPEPGVLPDNTGTKGRGEDEEGADGSFTQDNAATTPPPTSTPVHSARFPPTKKPTKPPTIFPTKTPSESPSHSPTKEPTGPPFRSATRAPTTDRTLPSTTYSPVVGAQAPRPESSPTPGNHPIGESSQHTSLPTWYPTQGHDPVSRFETNPTRAPVSSPSTPVPTMSGFNANNGSTASPTRSEKLSPQTNDPIWAPPASHGTPIPTTSGFNGNNGSTSSPQGNDPTQAPPASQGTPIPTTSGFNANKGSTLSPSRSEDLSPLGNGPTQGNKPTRTPSSSQGTPIPTIAEFNTDGSTLYPTTSEGLSHQGNNPTRAPSSSQGTKTQSDAEFITDGSTLYPTISEDYSSHGNDPPAYSGRIPTQAPSSSPPSQSPTETKVPSKTPSRAPSNAPTVTPMPTTSTAPSLRPTDTYTPTALPTSWEFFADGRERDEVIQHKCGLSSMDRTEIIMHAVKQFSGESNLLSGRSAQYRAYNWINRLDEGILCPEYVQNEQHDGPVYPRLLQRYSLAVFYFSTLGNDWTRCSGGVMLNDCDSRKQRWLSGASECNWYGVKCNEQGQVTHLHLPENGLEGRLPMEIFSLTAMKGLSLGHNGNITGKIPLEIAQWDQLEYLDLDGNNLEGPFPNVYDTATLQAIDLNNNRLSGNIGSAIGRLGQLVVLQIENNEFEGALPMEAISRLQQLVLFSSQGNNWTDPDWEILCDWVPDRRAVLSPGYLQFLLADCGETHPDCSCCSVCF